MAVYNLLHCEVARCFDCRLSADTSKVVIDSVFCYESTSTIVLAILYKSAIYIAYIAVTSSDDTTNPNLLSFILGRISEVSGNRTIVCTTLDGSSFRSSDYAADVVACTDLRNISTRNFYISLVYATLCGSIDNNTCDTGDD